MTNPIFELKKSLLPYYPDIPDEEINIITQDLISFFTELAEITNKSNDDETTSDLQQPEVNILKNQ